MRTTLPVEGVCRNESGIINLDNTEEPVAYVKRENHVVYFDNFSNFRLKELEYLANSVSEYNRTPQQRYSQNNCEQFCLFRLTNNLRTNSVLD